MTDLLLLDRVTKHFGGLAAVSDVSLRVAREEIVGLIGPNGAGKTTLFNVVSGVLKPTAGRVRFKGQDITGRAPHAIARRGLVRSFQLPTLFGSFSLRDNLVLASTPRVGHPSGDAAARADELVRFFGLDRVAGERAHNLPHGFQKRLEMAMALAGGPDLVLLDEPFCGLAAGEIEHASERIRELRTRGVTFVVVEHNMRALMQIVDRVYALNFGRQIGDGTPDEIARNPEVVAAYLGSARHAAGG